MELRQYVDVIKRRWLLVAAVVVLAGILSAALFVLRPATYTSSASFSVRIDPEAPPAATLPQYQYDRYYLWFSSEFLVDDYTLIVPSQAFGQEVEAQLKAANTWNEGLTADAIAAALTAERKHRVLTVSVESRDKGTAEVIINAVAAALTDQSLNKGPTPSKNGVAIDDRGLFGLLNKSPFAASNAGRSLTNAAVSLIVGLALGIALAFLLEFLDNSLRDRADAERVLGLPVMGTIPK